MSKKRVGVLVFLVIILSLVALVFQQWGLVQKTWNDEKTWGVPLVTMTKEGEKLIKLETAKDSYKAEMSSCSFYKSELQENGNLLLFCSLYPSRYFSALNWLSGSSNVVSDYRVEIPKDQVVVTYNGKAISFEELTRLTNPTKQVRIEIEGSKKASSMPFIAMIQHYLLSNQGKVDSTFGVMTKVLLTEKPEISKKEYFPMLFTPGVLSKLKSSKGQQRIAALLELFKPDSKAEDSSPHFTEGLVYGLYLLAEKEPTLTKDILDDLKNVVVPFRSPSLVEQEIQPTLTITPIDLVSAPHTKFPLCPIADVVAKKWDSTAIKIFMSYQQFQPPAVATSLEIDKLVGVYDENGNLLFYNEMVGVDALCQTIISKKDSAQVNKLRDIYQAFTNQYFVYTDQAEIGTPVIEGSDLLRSVVLRGLAKDPNISKQSISLDNIKRSLFDGILWEYLYGK